MESSQSILIQSCSDNNNDTKTIYKENLMSLLSNLYQKSSWMNTRYFYRKRTKVYVTIKNIFAFMRSGAWGKVYVYSLSVPSIITELFFTTIIELIQKIGQSYSHRKLKNRLYTDRYSFLPNEINTKLGWIKNRSITARSITNIRGNYRNLWKVLMSFYLWMY